MVQTWKFAPIIKGALTWVPWLNAWRGRRAATGGTDSARYCYGVWLRHLVSLDTYGFTIRNAHVGELGPGDSIGIGLAALVSGAASYVGLDLVPFSARANLISILDEIVDMYARKERIPGHEEFPWLRPRLGSYGFPERLIDWTGFEARAAALRRELQASVEARRMVNYRAPWDSPANIAPASLDLVFSQAVLEHVDALEPTYQAMFTWLKPGGYASHVIDFSAHQLSPYWNGHWSYSDRQWRLVRGRREFLLNREPIGTHLACAADAGFEALLESRVFDDHGIPAPALTSRYRALDAQDARTRGALLILRKPPKKDAR